MRGEGMKRCQLVKEIEATKSEYLKIKWCRTKDYRSRKNELPELAAKLSNLKKALHYIDNHLDFAI